LCPALLGRNVRKIRRAESLSATCEADPQAVLADGPSVGIGGSGAEVCEERDLVAEGREEGVRDGREAVVFECAVTRARREAKMSAKFFS
jgi:hypothetical protein